MANPFAKNATNYNGCLRVDANFFTEDENANITVTHVQEDYYGRSASAKSMTIVTDVNTGYRSLTVYDDRKEVIFQSSDNPDSKDFENAFDGNTNIDNLRDQLTGFFLQY